MNEFLEFLGWWMLISVVVGVAVGSFIRIGGVSAVTRPITNSKVLFLGRLSTAGNGTNRQRRKSSCRL